MIDDFGLDLALDGGLDPLAVAHSKRFRKVSNRDPLRVTQAYERDLARAMADRRAGRGRGCGMGEAPGS